MGSQDTVDKVWVVWKIVKDDRVESFQPKIGQWMNIKKNVTTRFTYMKKSNLGWPSSDSRNNGFENDLISWTKRVEVVTDRCLK